jgi:hypothetical protein
MVFLVAYPAQKLASYPLAYSLVVLPLSIARWSLFSHKEVSSASTFFGVSMFNLSGAINVLLLLLVRPRLLLFVPPAITVETATDPGRHSTSGSAVFPTVTKYNLSLQPTAMDDLGERSWKQTSGGSGNNMALSPTSSTAKSDDI